MVFDHPGHSEILTIACSKILRGIFFFFPLFGLATGMASEMFSLLCLDCIKGDGTFLDSIVIQRGRYTLTSFRSIVLTHGGFSEGFQETVKPWKEQMACCHLSSFLHPCNNGSAACSEAGTTS